MVRLYTLDGKLEREVPLPGLGSASGIVGRLDRPELFFSFTSPLYPATAFLYDAQTNKSQPFNPPKLTFDPAKFETERVFYTSKDGTRVPMFITHRRSLAKDGNNPTMLYAYGGFAISETPGFRPDVIAPLDSFCNQPITKLMLLGHPDIIADLAEALPPLLTESHCVRCDPELLQIMDKRANKAIALKKVADYYSVPLEQGMAIGDAANDVEMLQAAGIAVAVDNAHPSVKQVAHWIAPSNNDHGVHAALKRYGLCD